MKKITFHCDQCSGAMETDRAGERFTGIELKGDLIIDLSMERGTTHSSSRSPEQFHSRIFCSVHCFSVYSMHILNTAVAHAGGMKLPQHPVTSS